MKKEMILVIFVLFLSLNLANAQSDYGDINTVHIIGPDGALQGITEIARVKDALKLEENSIDSGEYFLKLVSLDNVTGQTSFQILGTGEKVDVNLMEDKNVDVNQDGIEDILLRTSNLYNETIQVFVQNLGNQPPPLETEEDENVEVKPNPIFQYGIYILIGWVTLVLFIVIMILILKTGKKDTEKLLAIKSGEPKHVDSPSVEYKVPQSHLEKAIILVEKARKKGASDKIIRALFASKGWKEQDINKILREKVDKPIKLENKQRQQMLRRQALKQQPLAGRTQQPPAKTIQQTQRPQPSQTITARTPEKLRGAIQVIKPQLQQEPERQSTANVPGQQTTEGLIDVTKKLVEDARKQGMPDEKIKEMFKKRGWPDKYINQIVG